jgi:hypothetical protein
MANWRRPCSSIHAPSESRRRAVPPLLLVALAASGCGHADEQRPAPGGEEEAVAEMLCRPVDEGFLEARLQGAVAADITWGEGATHCLGGVRPDGEGLRLIFKGSTPDTGPLLLVLGAGPLRAGESARNVPVNLTLVREGSGQFFATQGNDKCAFDEVRQAVYDGQPHRFRLEGRGYCTQPARAVAGEGAVLVSRFDVIAIVEVAP